jgi:putative tryptophan/tyrosine transport system substrate-binding protein
MRRRDFLAGATLAVTLRSAHAQQPKRVYRVGYLGINPTKTPIQAEVWKAFDEGLRAHGLIEGENVIVRRYFSEGREERQPGFVAELLDWKADVIVCGSLAGARAASQATKTIPIILAGIGEPVRLGFAKSLAKPGGNITGVSSQLVEVVRFYQLLKEIVPSLTRVAVLWNPNNVVWSLSDLERDVYRTLGLQMIPIPISGPEAVAAALEKIGTEQAEALDITNSVMTYRASILSFALEKRLPVIVSSRVFRDPGVLISYGPSLPEAFRRTAAYIDKVLKGASPADLPIELPSKIEVTLNLGTARTMGIDIPPHVLALADELVE